MGVGAQRRGQGSPIGNGRQSGPCDKGYGWSLGVRIQKCTDVWMWGTPLNLRVFEAGMAGRWLQLVRATWSRPAAFVRVSQLICRSSLEAYNILLKSDMLCLGR